MTLEIHLYLPGMVNIIPVLGILRQKDLETDIGYVGRLYLKTKRKNVVKAEYDSGPLQFQQLRGKREITEFEVILEYK